MEKIYRISFILIFIFLDVFIISFFIPSTIKVNSSENYQLSKANISASITEKEEDHYERTDNYSAVFPEISAKSYLVIDLDSGFVFAGKRTEEKFPIASLAKLMTAIVMVENVDLDESILVTEEMLDVYGSTEGIEEGKIFRAGELLYPLLIESSNSTGEILSYFLGKEKTIKIMNEKAKLISMEKTNFADSHGLSIENVSTAQDLFQLIKYVFTDYPSFLNISKGEIVKDFKEISFNIEELWNRNVFNIDPNFIGGKTGYLPKAKNTAIFVFEFVDENKDNRNIAIILLSSDGLKRDTQRIYKWLMDHHSLSPIVLF